VDVQNAVVWMPDSKTANGIAEVPPTPLAIEAFKSQMATAGEGPFLFPSDRIRGGEELFDEQRFPTFGFTTSAPRTPRD